jgi:hypothetical protein
LAMKPTAWAVRCLVRTPSKEPAVPHAWLWHALNGYTTLAWTERRLFPVREAAMRSVVYYRSLGWLAQLLRITRTSKGNDV